MMPQDQRESFQARCHAHGLRVTPQRIAVYEELCRVKNHPTAEQVHARLQGPYPTISLNTVNETLLTLAQVGLAVIVEGFGGPRRYDADTSPHHHLHCRECGTIFDFHHQAFNRIKLPQRVAGGFEVVGTRVVVTGVCTACRAKRRNLKRQ